MWFIIAAFYSELGYDADPEGMFGALTGFLVVGPVVAGLFVWWIGRRYVRETNEQTRMRLLTVAILTPVGLIVLGQILLS